MSDVEEKNKKHEKIRKVNVSCEGIYKIYKQGNLEVIALKDINLKVYSGEIIIIIGPSGAGKTTLLNVLSGLEQPNAGKVFIKNQELTSLNDKGIQYILQNEIGIVFQFFNLVPTLTSYGNIELPMIIAKKPIKYRKKRVKELLHAIDLENRFNHRPHELSGGEKQRIAIAKAFANNPTIILADEPTGNIDSISAEAILQIFRSFIENYPEKSIIIVSHDPIFRKIADRTLVIKDGKIIRELGRYDLSMELEGKSQKNGDYIAQLNELGVVSDEVQQILSPGHRVIEYDNVIQCPNCHSENIIKKYDKGKAVFKIEKNQVLIRTSVFCQDCLQLTFIDTAIYDVKKEFV